MINLPSTSINGRRKSLGSLAIHSSISLSDSSAGLMPSLATLGLRAENRSAVDLSPNMLRISSASRRCLKKSRSANLIPLDESAALVFWHVCQFFHQYSVMDAAGMAIPNERAQLQLAAPVEDRSFCRRARPLWPDLQASGLLCPAQSQTPGAVPRRRYWGAPW